MYLKISIPQRPVNNVLSSFLARPLSGLPLYPNALSAALAIMCIAKNLADSVLIKDILEVEMKRSRFVLNILRLSQFRFVSGCSRDELADRFWL